MRLADDIDITNPMFITDNARECSQCESTLACYYAPREQNDIMIARCASCHHLEAFPLRVPVDSASACSREHRQE